MINLMATEYSPTTHISIVVKLIGKGLLSTSMHQAVL